MSCLCTIALHCNGKRSRNCIVIFKYLCKYYLFFLQKYDITLRFRLAAFFRCLQLLVYRVSHSKDWKVILLWWGYRFWFLLVFWILRVHEIGPFHQFLFIFDAARQNLSNLQTCFINLTCFFSHISTSKSAISQFAISFSGGKVCWGLTETSSSIIS